MNPASEADYTFRKGGLLMKDDTAVYWHCRHVGKRPIPCLALCYATKDRHRVWGPLRSDAGHGWRDKLLVVQAMEDIAPGGSGYVLARGETPHRLLP